MQDQDNAELLAEAHRGDQGAWQEIVRRYIRLVWAVARSHRLSPEDAADVNQTVWLVLAQNLTRIRRPDRLGSWLTTTARRESLAVLRLRGREEPTDLWEPAHEGPNPEDLALISDTDSRLWRAYTTLTDRCREILHLVAFAPELSFKQMAQAVGIPPNSLGPTRSRCLEVLRRRLARETVG
ncbi:RNA polymerase sigma factor (sigma-70 family) [Saccharothrix tamanrassetensis]|uniref:RNA polymerase sigma factor (Sigma-70 family) n=1 Tax=Saccharothrix tamanrassetensis TaxID=1051531 RepID=A0A841C815_9PSEU|nr:sigma-70 family RNA polymerase sigma factor [Saccharothrix tamanrassetensis]MBB5954662.1 RNA polymerase sigma factor (sigma-70 family) [Saccharothrix tamanrassetensis]